MEQCLDPGQHAMSSAYHRTVWSDLFTRECRQALEHFFVGVADKPRSETIRT